MTFTLGKFSGLGLAAAIGCSDFGETHPYWRAVTGCHERVDTVGADVDGAALSIKLHVFFVLDDEGERFFSPDDLEVLMRQVRDSFEPIGISFVVEDAGEITDREGDPIVLVKKMEREGLIVSDDSIPVVLGFDDIYRSYGVTVRPDWRYSGYGALIAIDPRAANQAPHTLSHELGHFFGLFHLDEFGGEKCGDGLSDTPPFSRDNPMREGASSPGDLFVFTPQQAAVMRCVADELDL